MAKKIQTDAEFAGLIPPLSAYELKGLETSIVAEGCRDALVVWKGILLDGHNRYEICQRHGLKFQTVEREFAHRGRAMEWIIRNQFARRNISAYQRSKLALKLKPLLAAKAKERMLAGKADPVQTSAQGKTRDELASIAGVSHDTIAKVEVIEKEADAETLSKLDAGETTINKVYTNLAKEKKNAAAAAERKKQSKAAAKHLGDDLCEIHHADFRDFARDRMPDNSVDLIFTDPPYNRDAVPLYGDLAEVGARVLKPGGSLLCYCGQYVLPDIMALMTPHLRLWWVNAVIHTGPKARMTEYGIVVHWKPLLWFVKDTRRDKQTFVDDAVEGRKEKSHHPWQQAIPEAAYYIEKLTTPGELVFDPFCGGGTTCVAAKRLGRTWVACEVDETTAVLARGRVKDG